MTIIYAVRECRPGDVIDEGDPIDPVRELPLLVEYFAKFDAPRLRPNVQNVFCSCGEPLMGYLGTIEWVDDSQDEGGCRNCNRPLRQFHHVGNLGIKTVPLLFRLGL